MSDANMPSEEEIQKRIALKKLFLDNMNKLSIAPKEQYVSKLIARPTIEKPPVEKISPNKLKHLINEFMQPLAKKMWAPQIKKRSHTSSYEDTCSKYFGDPWLYADEDWPTLNDTPLLFVMQLNIAALPKEMSTQLGGTGLLQFFFDTVESLDDHLVRIVDISKPGKTLQQPEVENFPTSKEKIIISWKEYVDYPHSEDLNEVEGFEELKELADGNGFYIHDLCGQTYQGDKLGGYPFWTQAGNGTDDYVYQIDAGSFYDGLKVPAYAPNLFASDGTGHIFINHEDKEGSFSWACG